MASGADTHTHTHTHTHTYIRTEVILRNQARAWFKNPLKYSFLSRTIPLWNQLPQDLVNSNSLISFKNKLDDYMIEL